MADNHFQFDRNKPAGFRLGRGCEALENAIQWLTAERLTMIQMMAGASNDPASYNEHVLAYGFQSNDEAMAAFNELDSIMGRLNTDGNISGVQSAISQFLARLRN